MDQTTTHRISAIEVIGKNIKQFFSKENITNKAKQMGINFDKFTEEELEVATMMVYTDYCKTLGTSNMDLYLRLAKDWLEDDDVAVRRLEGLGTHVRKRTAELGIALLQSLLLCQHTLDSRRRLLSPCRQQHRYRSVVIVGTDKILICVKAAEHGHAHTVTAAAASLA